MYDPYEDIKTRIREKPTWYDVHGVPRYGEIPDNLKPFIRRIKCQACHKVFKVCLVGNVYKTYGDVMFTYKPVSYKKLKLDDGREMDVPDHYEAVYMKSEVIPDEWHYGDAPGHDRPDAKPDAKGWDRMCVGAVESSIPEYIWGTEGYEEYES